MPACQGLFTLEVPLEVYLVQRSPSASMHAAVASCVQLQFAKNVRCSITVVVAWGSAGRTAAGSSP